jgi:hypothetical protein
MDSGAAVDRKLVAAVVSRWRGQATTNKPARETSSVDWGLAPR